jgi:hypothetical protein
MFEHKDRLVLAKVRTFLEVHSDSGPGLIPGCNAIDVKWLTLTQ